MSQQEFMELSRHHEEVSIYETQGSIEPAGEYPVWEQNNEFVDRHLRGEKVQPQPGKKSAAWSLIPLLVLLLLIAGGAFGLTAVFHSINLSSPSPWNDDDFVPNHGWHHHHPHCQVITDLVHQSALVKIQGDDSDHIIIIQGQYACSRP
jgi:hypothetical protein